MPVSSPSQPNKNIHARYPKLPLINQVPQPLKPSHRSRPRVILSSRSTSQDPIPRRPQRSTSQRTPRAINRGNSQAGSLAQRLRERRIAAQQRACGLRESGAGGLPSGFEPVCVEVEEREDEDEEQDRAVDAWPLQDVVCGEEEDDVDW